MNLLALDPATKTGYAIGENGNVISSGAWDNTPKKATKKQPGESKHYRLEKLWWKLEDFGLNGNVKIDHVIFEGATGFQRGKAAVESSHQFRAIILLWASLNDIPITEIQPQDLKRFATGKGNADKPEMLKAAIQKGYAGSTDDNEVDAWLILQWAFQWVPSHLNG
jgi:Holliday junction resolvasome RuvABC endonuclease subunit